VISAGPLGADRTDGTAHRRKSSKDAEIETDWISPSLRGPPRDAVDDLSLTEVQSEPGTPDALNAGTPQFACPAFA